jgi:hypothetical protein
MGVQAQRTVPESGLAVSKRFGRYKDEGEKAVRVPQVAEDQTLKRLKEAFLKVHCNDILIRRQYYDAYMDAVRGLEYTSKDVEKFGIALAEFQDMEHFALKAGYFLSALINNCPDGDFVVHTGHLDREIGFLGLFNTKNITIEGDAGGTLGYRMESGRIIVEGNANGAAGTSMKAGEIVINGDAAQTLGQGMKGGKITVRGNSLSHAGWLMENGEVVICGNSGNALGGSMKGGKITVRGNAGNSVGIAMTGGQILVEGDCGSLADNIRGGKIFHKGKLIFPKGDGDAG